MLFDGLLIFFNLFSGLLCNLLSCKLLFVSAGSTVDCNMAAEDDEGNE